jgi:signal transduction histidine kinase
MRLTYKRVRSDRSDNEPLPTQNTEPALRLAQTTDPAKGCGTEPSCDEHGVGVDQGESVELRLLLPAGRAAPATAPAGLAHDLADARQEVAELKRENATLRARLGGEDNLPRAGTHQLTAVRPDGFAPSGPRGNGRPRTSDGTAGDAARERLGQDLHDGVQQRLTALRIRVALAADSVEIHDDTQGRRVLDDIGDEVDRAIDEVRAFARGVYPALLTSSGLSAALASVNRRSPQSVTILAADVGRYSPEIEIAVYFSCLAALDNAARHAGAAPVTVRVWDHADGLHFTISDTGHGFDLRRTVPGAGLTNMRDRIAGVGGSLTIDSSSRGTVVEGSVTQSA